MDRTGEIKSNGQRPKALKDAKTLRGHDARHQGKDPDRSGFHDDDGNFHHRFRSAVKPLRDRLRNLARHQNPDPEHDGEENDLENIAGGEGLYRIGRDDIEQTFNNSAGRISALRHRFHTARIRIRKGLWRKTGARLEYGRHNQAECHRDGGRSEISRNGADA